MDADAWRAVDACLIVLRRKVSLTKPTHNGGDAHRECASLVLTLPVQSNADEQRRLRVALDLLQTLWVLNRDAWCRAMVHAVGEEIPAALFMSVASNNVPLTVVIRIMHHMFADQVQPGRWQALLDPVVRLTDAEARIKRALLQEYGHGDIPIPAIPLRLDFLVFGMATSAVQALVAKAVDMVEAERDLRDGIATDDALDMCALLTLDSLDLDLDWCGMTSAIARQVLQLHALGIRVHCLTIRMQTSPDDSVINREDDTTERARLLRVLLGPAEGNSTTPVNSKNSRFPIETLVIVGADLAEFRAVCAALESTRHVQHVELRYIFVDDSLADRASKWEWITCALFAPSSRTSIKHLSLITDDITVADADTVANTLQTFATQTSGRGGNHALETVAMRSLAPEPTSADATPRLLQLIGPEMVALTVNVWWSAWTVDWLAPLHRACPKLRFLDVDSIQADSLDSLLGVYDRDNCRIQSLILRSVYIRHDSITAFARALRDPSRAVSRVLRALCISPTRGRNLDQDNLDAFHALLKCQYSPLEYLELRVTDPLFTQNHSRFALHHNTWATGIAALLPLASKTALLSVCRSLTRSGRSATDSADAKRTPSSIYDLDDHALSLIFQFAAARSRKSVFMHPALF